ncbi:hypothetical protein BC830DRAFT_1082445 [Chytriomyces sp. MP71]|nr:hypothetical protein BC830DRAFT_1082445 [Chytriomyces sp. MP71]
MSNCSKNIITGSLRRNWSLFVTLPHAITAGPVRRCIVNNKNNPKLLEKDRVAKCKLAEFDLTLPKEELEAKRKQIIGDLHNLKSNAVHKSRSKTAQEQKGIKVSVSHIDSLSIPETQTHIKNALYEWTLEMLALEDVICMDTACGQWSLRTSP